MPFETITPQLVLDCIDVVKGEFSKMIEDSRRELNQDSNVGRKITISEKLRQYNAAIFALGELESFVTAVKIGHCVDDTISKFQKEDKKCQKDQKKK